MLKTNFNFDNAESVAKGFDSAPGAPDLGDEAEVPRGPRRLERRRARSREEPSDLGSLAELSPGRDAVIASLDASGPVGRRLLDLGLLPGTPVRALRHAPLGDPSVFELRGYRLCLRRSESSRVRLRARSHTPPSGP